MNCVHSMFDGIEPVSIKQKPTKMGCWGLAFQRTGCGVEFVYALPNTQFYKVQQQIYASSCGKFFIAHEQYYRWSALKDEFVFVNTMSHLCKIVGGRLMNVGRTFWSGGLFLGVRGTFLHCVRLYHTQGEYLYVQMADNQTA